MRNLHNSIISGWHVSVWRIVEVFVKYFFFLRSWAGMKKEKRVVLQIDDYGVSFFICILHIISTRSQRWVEYFIKHIAFNSLMPFMVPMFHKVVQYSAIWKVEFQWELHSMQPYLDIKNNTKTPILWKILPCWNLVLLKNVWYLLKQTYCRPIHLEGQRMYTMGGMSQSSKS